MVRYDERSRGDWDGPHVLPDGLQDPFTIFLCNEKKIAWIRSHYHGYSELQVREARRTLDTALKAYHAHLVEGLLKLSPQEREHWWDFVPQVEFWSRPQAVDTQRPKHPAWPWTPEDAIGDARID